GRSRSLRRSPAPIAPPRRSSPWAAPPPGSRQPAPTRLGPPAPAASAARQFAWFRRHFDRLVVLERWVDRAAPHPAALLVVRRGGAGVAEDGLRVSRSGEDHLQPGKGVDAPDRVVGDPRLRAGRVDRAERDRAVAGGEGGDPVVGAPAVAAAGVVVPE